MKTTELENTYTNVNIEDNKDYSKIEYENIEKTPFTIVKQDETYFGTIGNHKITETYGNREELYKELTEFSWDRVAQVIWAVVEKYKEIKNE